MISPKTPPGTPLVVVMVCETAEEAASLCAPAWRPVLIRKWNAGELRSEFRLGERCTLRRIVVCAPALQGYAAEIEGREGIYALESFRVATLPRCLTDLLRGKRIPELS